jgi:hypothetical protein
VDEFLAELGETARGYTEISSSSDANAWEQRVAQIAPERVRQLARKHAQQLALETAPARNAAMEYVRRIREISDEPVMEYLEYQLRSRSTLAQQQLADRFSAGGVPYDVQDASKCAAFAVALFGAEIDAEHGGFAEEPANKSRELKLRLNIAADMLRLGKP